MYYTCSICCKKATWEYAPSLHVLQFYQSFYCDDCVPRGCSCQTDEEGVDYVDSKGKKYPCVEYFESPEGIYVTPCDIPYILINKAHEGENNELNKDIEKIDMCCKTPFKKYAEDVITMYGKNLLASLIERGYIIVNKDAIPHDILK